MVSFTQCCCQLASRQFKHPDRKRPSIGTSQQFKIIVLEMMFLWCVLVLVNLVSVATDTNAGVKVRLTQKGLEYGRQIAIASIQQKLRTIQLQDISGTERVKAVGKVQYSFTG
ncbi:bactericidal permeability-increasing -like protein [Labeo rohita]|nr:bactericidal permeability-increasing -like protein [Labeo rohita]